MNSLQQFIELVFYIFQAHNPPSRPFNQSYISPLTHFRFMQILTNPSSASWCIQFLARSRPLKLQWNKSIFMYYGLSLEIMVITIKPLPVSSWGKKLLEWVSFWKIIQPLNINNLKDFIRRDKYFEKSKSFADFLSTKDASEIFYDYINDQCTPPASLSLSLPAITLLSLILVLQLSRSQIHNTSQA